MGGITNLFKSVFVYTNIRLYRYPAIWIYSYTIIRLYRYAVLKEYPVIRISSYTDIRLYRYSFIQIPAYTEYGYTDIRFYGSPIIRISRCTDIQIFGIYLVIRIYSYGYPDEICIQISEWIRIRMGFIKLRLGLALNLFSYGWRGLLYMILGCTCYIWFIYIMFI
jgi:hypothetical protein